MHAVSDSPPDVRRAGEEDVAVGRDPAVRDPVVGRDRSAASSTAATTGHGGGAAAAVGTRQSPAGTGRGNRGDPPTQMDTSYPGSSGFSECRII